MTDLSVAAAIPALWRVEGRLADPDATVLLVLWPVKVEDKDDRLARLEEERPDLTWSAFVPEPVAGEILE